MKIISDILVICSLMIIISCSNNKVELLEKDLEEKTEEIDELQLKILVLETELYNQKIDIQKVKEFSDEEIITFIKNELEFTCPKTKIKDFVIRRSSNILFEVRFYQRLGNIHGYYWDKVIVHIHILPNNLLKYDLWSGVYCKD